MDIKNKTKRPIRVPLAGGKRLFLGPGGLGQITPKAVDSPAVKKLIEAGDLELQGKDGIRKSGELGGSGGSKGPGTGGGSSGGGMRHTGDR